MLGFLRVGPIVLRTFCEENRKLNHLEAKRATEIRDVSVVYSEKVGRYNWKVGSVETMEIERVIRGKDSRVHRANLIFNGKQ